LSDRARVAALVLGVFAARWPGRVQVGQLDEGVSLGEGGLELDSIEIAELVIECMDRLGLPGDGAETLLEAGPLSIGRLIDHLAAA
jgi:acyl carrier protein